MFDSFESLKKGVKNKKYAIYRIDEEFQTIGNQSIHVGAKVLYRDSTTQMFKDCTISIEQEKELQQIWKE